MQTATTVFCGGEVQQSRTEERIMALPESEILVAKTALLGFGPSVQLM